MLVCVIFENEGERDANGMFAEGKLWSVLCT